MPSRNSQASQDGGSCEPKLTSLKLNRLIEANRIQNNKTIWIGSLLLLMRSRSYGVLIVFQVYGTHGSSIVRLSKKIGLHLESLFNVIVKRQWHARKTHSPIRYLT